MTDSPIIQALLARMIHPGTAGDLGGHQMMPPGGVGAMPRTVRPMNAGMLTSGPMPPGGTGQMPRVVRQMQASELFGPVRQY